MKADKLCYHFSSKNFRVLILTISPLNRIKKYNLVYLTIQYSSVDNLRFTWATAYTLITRDYYTMTLPPQSYPSTTGTRDQQSSWSARSLFHWTHIAGPIHYRDCRWNYDGGKPIQHIQTWTHTPFYNYLFFYQFASNLENLVTSKIIGIFVRYNNEDLNWRVTIITPWKLPSYKSSLQGSNIFSIISLFWD